MTESRVLRNSVGVQGCILGFAIGCIVRSRQGPERQGADLFELG